MNEHLEGEPPRRISRRTIAKGMQWALPVIAVGAPAPAYAPSGNEIVAGNGAACKANTDYPNLVVLTQGAGDSQAGTLTATHTISGRPGGAVTASTVVGTAPPIQGASCTGFTAADKACIARQQLLGG